MLKNSMSLSSYQIDNNNVLYLLYKLHVFKPDQFCCSYGTIHDVRKIAGLDVESIRNFIQS